MDHFSVNVSGIVRSEQFYKEILAPLGNEMKLDFGTTVNFGKNEIISRDSAGSFWLAEGEPKLIHFAFSASSKEEVKAFYNAGLKAGGTDNGKPGIRPDYGSHYYAAFILDPDGYNIEAVYHGA